MMSTRRALVVTKNDFREERDGGSKRTAALIRALETRGFEVDWLAARPFISSRDLTKVTRMGPLKLALRSLFAAVATLSLSTLRWHSLRLSIAVASMSDEIPYDVVVLEHSQIAPLRHAVRARLVCVDTHNVEAELLSNYASSARGWRRSAASYESSRLRKLEATFSRAFDIVVAVSPRDAQWFEAHGESQVVVAPNGVSDEFFGVSGERTGGVVFVGHLGWRPNVDAARWMTTEVWPLVAEAAPRTSLNLVGKRPSSEVLALAGSHVSVSPNVPSVIPYLSSARVATAPLLSAGGTRIKILEALASGTPVVATPLGALGLEHLAGPGFRIAETPAAFAENVVELLNSTISRGEVRASVRGYSWDKSLEPLISAIEQGANARGR